MLCGETSNPPMNRDNDNGDGSFDDWSVNFDMNNNFFLGDASSAMANVAVEQAQQQEQQQQQQQQHEQNYLEPEELALIDTIPPQLHPAVSMGMKRVSSCYFSVRSEGSSNSVADLLSLLDEQQQFENSNNNSNKGKKNTNSQEEKKQNDDVGYGETKEDVEGTVKPSWSSSSSELLYHDILMNVFTFLDAPSLSAVSETTRSLNFEVFYFLNLQLQRALIPGARGNDYSLSSIAGVSIIRRLANWNRPEAEALVQEFLDSNASLRQMPLSHSLAYMRQVFQNNTKSPSSQALASAALLVTLLGAASSFQMPEISPEIPNMLFRLMGAASLMGAAKSMTETPPEKLRERAEQMKQQAACMAGRLQEASNQFLQGTRTTDAHFPSWSQLMRMAYSAAHGVEMAAATSSDTPHAEHGARFLFSRDPYAHLPAGSTNSNGVIGHSVDASAKTPTGCIGAYLRTVGKATKRIAEKVRESRRQRFEQFSPQERQELSRRFLEACTSNDSLDQVKAIVNNGVDVDGFYVGADGTETCALHTAAFNGASAVIEFLCSGIDDEGGSSSGNDGGLCDVNCRDSNAWTALHFAAGSNSVDAVRVLVKHGGNWAVEANNGYTPYQWAVRLKHHQVAEELKELASQSHLQNHGWMTHRPLSAIASRFFALVMVQSQ